MPKQSFPAKPGNVNVAAGKQPDDLKNLSAFFSLLSQIDTIKRMLAPL
jgi:hypothetical protein